MTLVSDRCNFFFYPYVLSPIACYLARLTSVTFTTNTMLAATIIVFLLTILVATEPDQPAEESSESAEGSLAQPRAVAKRSTFDQWTRVRRRFCPSRCHEKARAGETAGASPKISSSKLLP